jgi:hypothetical protein
VHLRPSSQLPRRTNPSSRSSCPLVLSGIFSWQSGGCTLVTREVTNHHFHSPSNEPLRNVAGISSWDRVHWGSLEGSNILLCQHRLSGLVSKGWAPRTKRSHLMYPCMQVTEAKSKAQPTYGCMWLYWLFYSPSAMWPSSSFTPLSFTSLFCHLFSRLTIRTQLVCFFFGPPPCYNNTSILYVESWQK